MRARFINKTHRTVVLERGAELKPFSTEVFTITDTKKALRLAEKGIIQIASEADKTNRAGSTGGAPAAQFISNQRQQIADEIRAARRKKEEEKGVASLQPSTKTTKATSNSNKTNAKGK